MLYRKPSAHLLAEFAPWTIARFGTQDARDRFLWAAATLPARDVEVKPLPGESRGASVRWRPGSFLSLNDLAYAHGGKIAVDLTARGATVPWATRTGYRISRAR